MTKKILALLVLTSLFGCDDGTIENPSFQFETDIESRFGECTGRGDRLLFYQISTGNREALTLDLDASNDSDNSFYTTEYTNLNNSTVDVNYRIFNSDLTSGSGYFCQNIPPTSPSVVSNWTGTATIILENTITIDDGDGVDNDLEDVNQDGDLENDDTDGDGIPDYKDEDDDGDGIDTRIEIAHYIEANSDDGIYDTDGDGTPNYRDTDDDGDGTPTNLENIEDPNGIGGRHYLDNSTTTPEAEKRFQSSNTFNTSYSLKVVLNNLNLVNSTNNNTIRFDTFTYGFAPLKTEPTTQNFDENGILIIEQ